MRYLLIALLLFVFPPKLPPLVCNDTPSAYEALCQPPMETQHSPTPFPIPHLPGS